MNRDLFENYSIRRSVLTLAIPNMLSMLVTVIYNLADTLFIGQLGDVNQIAAISLTQPIFLILMSVGNIFGIGGGIHISRLLGVKEYEKIKSVSSLNFYIGLVVSIIFGVLILTFLDPILKLIGTSIDTYQHTKDYIQVLALGTPTICLQIILAVTVRSEGAPRASMVGMLIGTVLNIVLDPIMIINMNMGMLGAAIATIIGNAASILYFLIHILKNGKKGKTYLSINLKNIKPIIKDYSFILKTLKSIILLGIPMSVNNLLMSYATTLINNFASSYGDDSVAALGIANRVSMISVLTFVGLAQGAQPLLAYSNSSKNYKRMNDTIKFTGILTTVIGLFVLSFIFLFSKQIVGLFIQETSSTGYESVINYGSYFIRVLTTSAPILGLLYLFMCTFQAIEATTIAILVSLCRQGLIFTTIIFIGNYLFKLNGIIWAQPVADITSLIISILVYFYLYKKFIKDEISIENGEVDNSDNDIKNEEINNNLNTENINNEELETKPYKNEI